MVKSKKEVACIYARVSTEEQEKEGFSIPAQLKLLRGMLRNKVLKLSESLLKVKQHALQDVQVLMKC